MNQIRRSELLSEIKEKGIDKSPINFVTWHLAVLAIARKQCIEESFYLAELIKDILQLTDFEIVNKSKKGSFPVGTNGGLNVIFHKFCEMSYYSYNNYPKWLMTDACRQRDYNYNNLVVKGRSHEDSLSEERKDLVWISEVEKQ